MRLPNRKAGAYRKTESKAFSVRIANGKVEKSKSWGPIIFFTLYNVSGQRSSKTGFLHSFWVGKTFIVRAPVCLVNFLLLLPQLSHTVFHFRWFNSYLSFCFVVITFVFAFSPHSVFSRPLFFSVFLCFSFLSFLAFPQWSELKMRRQNSMMLVLWSPATLNQHIMWR